MDMEEVLRLVAAVVDRAWWKCASDTNRELLSEIGYACRAFAEEIAKSKAATAPKPEPVYADDFQPAQGTPPANSAAPQTA